MTQRAQCVAGKRSTQPAANTFTLQLTHRTSVAPQQMKNVTQELFLLCLLFHILFTL
jgi:hypothetical protein